MSKILLFILLMTMTSGVVTASSLKGNREVTNTQFQDMIDLFKGTTPQTANPTPQGESRPTDEPRGYELEANPTPTPEPNIGRDTIQQAMDMWIKASKTP